MVSANSGIQTNSYILRNACKVKLKQRMKNPTYSLLQHALALILILMTLQVRAIEIEGNGIRFTIDNATRSASVSGTDNTLANIVIPSAIEHGGVRYPVTGIADYALATADNLREIAIPNSIKSIGEGAFKGCSNLTSIRIPNSVTSIGKEAFNGCSGMTSATISDSVTAIGSRLFFRCTSLTSIKIPSSVTSIWYDAFYETPWYNNLPDGPVYINNVLFRYKGIMPLNTSLEVREGTVYISPFAFYRSISLASIKIPGSVTSIGMEAFSGCSNLSSIKIPSSVVSIGNSAFIGTPWYDNKPNGVVYINNVLYGYKGTMPTNTKLRVRKGTVTISSFAFSGCSNLTSVRIPNSVTSIEPHAFSGCTGLASIEIPNSVTDISLDVFFGCTGLTSLTISAQNIGNEAFRGFPKLSHLTIGEGVGHIGARAFAECPLKSVTIPNSTTSIEEGCFYKCPKLSSVTIGDSLISIPKGCFAHCTELETIRIGKRVSSVEEHAFTFCEEIKDIFSYAGTPPKTVENSFGTLSQTTLHVPHSSLESYKTAKPWNFAKSIIPATE